MAVRDTCISFLINVLMVLLRRSTRKCSVFCVQLAADETVSLWGPQIPMLFTQVVSLPAGPPSGMEGMALKSLAIVDLFLSPIRSEFALWGSISWCVEA